MDRKVDFKQLADNEWHELAETRKECAKKMADTNELKDVYLQVNKLLDSQEKALKFANNQYVEKDGLFTPLFNNSMRFGSAREAKLYDTLFEFFNGNENDNDKLTIIGMVQSYVEKD